MKIRDLEIDKLRVFEAVIFLTGKAKFFRTAALLSKILTQLVGKRTSQMRSLLFAKSLSYKYLLWAIISSLPFCFLQANPDTLIALEKPSISANTPICQGLTLKMETPFQDGVTFHWYDPEGNEISVVPTAIIPNIELDMAGIYSLKAEKDGCFSEAAFIEIEVIIKPPAPIVSNNGPLCEGETLLLDGPSLANTTYKWIDPFGTVISNEEDVRIENIPKELSGDYFLEITQLGCPSHLGGTDVGVIPVNQQPELIINGSICEDDTLIIKGPHIAGAMYRWEGPNGFQSDATDSLLFPIAKTNLNGLYSLVLEATGCASPKGEVLVEIFPKALATLSGGGTLCEGESMELNIELGGTAPFEFKYAINEVPQAKIRTENFNHSFIIQPDSNQNYTLLSVSDKNGCAAEVHGMAEIKVFPKPVISLISDTICDDINENYRLQVKIENGIKPFDYQGLNGELSDTVFTSNLLPNNEPYSFQIIDANQCSSEKIRGSYSCPCATDAGTVDTMPIYICSGETAKIIHLNNEKMDGNDALFFVLHDSPTSVLGNIFATSAEPEFKKNDDLIDNQTYYVSPIAANRQENLVDFSDRCLSVSPGTPLTFSPGPEQPSIFGEQTVCPGGVLELNTQEYSGNVQYHWHTPVEMITTSVPQLIINNAGKDYSGDFRVSVEEDACISTLSERYAIAITAPSEAADAGPNTISCGLPHTFLNAKTPSLGFGKWTPPSGVYLEDPFHENTKASSLQAGKNTFYWILSTEECPDFQRDSVIITYQPKARAVYDGLTLKEDETFVDFNISKNDMPPEDYLTWIEVTTEPHVGALEDLGEGNFSYKRAFGFEGRTFFRYALCFETEECPVLCDTGVVEIDVKLDPFDPGVYIPDGITPNNDGINDVLVIEGLEYHENNELILFDRWGNLVFQDSPYQNNWDGTFRNQPLPEGTYYYIFKTAVVDKRTLKGRVYIIR